MATTFKEGDRVQIVDREANAEDAKSGLFYNHFRGLTGTVQKVYPTQEVAVEIEPESLAEPVGQRHADVQEQMKSKWLDGLSEEARGRLSDQEKDFRLRYTILVGLKDLTSPGKKTTPAAAQKKTEAPPSAPAPTAKAPAATPAPRSGTPPSRAADPPTTPPRKTLEDIEAAEEAEFQRRQRNGK